MPKHGKLKQPPVKVSSKELKYLPPSMLVEMTIPLANWKRSCYETTPSMTVHDTNDARLIQGPAGDIYKMMMRGMLKACATAPVKHPGKCDP